MSATIAKYTAKKVLGDRINQNKDKKVCGKKDPFFDITVDKKGKQRKVKKVIPEFIPERDAEVLADVRAFAYKMDMCLFTFAGVRFGWSSVIGLIPELGDVIDMFLAAYCYSKIIEVHCPLRASTHAKMIGNIVIDFVVGLIPLVGDMADAGFKCNTRNAVLLSKALEKHYGGKRTKSEIHRMSRAPLDGEENIDFGAPPPYTGPTPPDPTAAPNATRTPRGFFGSRSGRDRDYDPEMGDGRR